MDKGDAYGMFKDIKTKIKKVALNMSDIEIKVEEATNNEPWGPHGTAMADIAKASYNWEQYRQIMGVIGRRLQSSGEDWRHVYKSLLLLDYLLKHGPTRIIQELDSSLSVIERFHNFKYVDASGKDCGINVRHRAKELSALIRDRERVDKERAKAKELKSKYGGMSRDEASYGGGRSYSSSRQLDDYDSGLDRAAGRDSGRMEGFGSDSYRGSRGGATSSEGGYDPWPSPDDPPPRKAPTYTDDAGDDDPVTATQRRIQDLKVKGLVDDAQDGDTQRPPPRPRTDHRSAPPPPARKRLSDMKVNPQIAATLAVPGGAPLAAVPPPARPAPAPTTAAPTAASDDLVGGLSAPAAAGGSVTGGDGGQGGWDAFGGGPSTTAAAPTAPPAGDDLWDAFASERAAPAGPPQHATTGLLAAAASPTAAAPPATHNDAFDAFVGSAAPAPAAAPLADLLGDMSTASAVPTVPTTDLTMPAVTAPAALNADLFSMGAPAAPATGPSMIQMGVQLPVGLNVPMAPVAMAPGGMPGMVAMAPGAMPGMVAVQVPAGWGVAGMQGQAVPMGGMVVGMGGPGMGAVPLATVPSAVRFVLGGSTM